MCLKGHYYTKHNEAKNKLLLILRKDFYYVFNKYKWVYTQFCYVNDCHQVASRGKHNQAKTTASSFPAHIGEVTKNLNQVKRDTDCGAIAKSKKPHRTGVPPPA